MAVALPLPRSGASTLAGRPAWVVVYNDDWHTFDEVIAQLVKAGACGREEAELHAWKVHTQGRSRVYQGPRTDCERVAGVLREIRLQVEVDWND